MSQGRLHGSRASAPEPCRCVSLGNVHPPDLRSIHPALTEGAFLQRDEVLVARHAGKVAAQQRFGEAVIEAVPKINEGGDLAR